MGKVTTRESLRHRWKIAWMFLIVVLVLLTPTLVWWFSPSRVMNVWVLDKTVPDKSYREHKGLFWVLNHFRIRQPQIGAYQYRLDYYGFFPQTKDHYETRDFHQAGTKNPDLIYIADTYGVYKNDYLADKPTGDKSPILYGGLTDEDVFSLKMNLKNKTTLIAEYNTFNTPTSEKNRAQMEEILGIRWQEWMGRYFVDLRRDQEVSNWMIEQYEAKTDQRWEFTGEGYVLTSNWGDIIVLERGKDFGKEDLLVEFLGEYKNEFGIAQKIPYYYWFDYVKPAPGSEVIATFDLNLNETGLEKLKRVGLTGIFPAIIRHRQPAYTSYYLAGDMADHESAPWNYMISGSHWIRRWFSLNIKGEAGSFYWRGYVPMMRKILFDITSNRNGVILEEEMEKAFIQNNLSMVSRIHENSMQIYQKKNWRNLFIKAVNMSMAEPGKWFTEFPQDEATYSRWLNWIGEMNCNAIRVYTLMDPSFYRALYLYNQAHPDAPLWLLQDIWPEENPKNNNYLDKTYNEQFQQEIRYGIDAVHGEVEIPERKGRAWGVYQADVSPYVLAWLMGRELEAKEALDNDKLNQGFQFRGEYFTGTKEATPTEGWLAESCDFVASYEADRYRWSRPVSIVSWPTMDVLEHESEWEPMTDKSNQFNDLTSININHIETTDRLVSGFFGTYHIYPNYPDFMNNDEKYTYYRDEQGQFMYGGYLRDFIAAQSRYPAFVGEFGLAGGMGNAHSNPDGLHHGSHTEVDQGKGIIRMMKAIQREKYMGGAVFEWMDEWAKKTWTTEPFMIPYDRHVLWHNMVCPEQNYGILANEAIEKVTSEYTLMDSAGVIEKAEMRTNEEFFFLDLYSREPLDLENQTLYIGLDTVMRFRGENYYTPSKTIQAPSGMEFLIQIQQGSAKLLVIPSYNFSKMKFASSNLANGVFETMDPVINKARVTKRGRVIQEVREEASLLREGPFEGTNHHWFQDGKHIRLRIPWQRLLVTDPSSHMVLNDLSHWNSYPLRDTFKTVKTEGFVVSAVLMNSSGSLLDIFPGDHVFDNPAPFLWKGWDKPKYRERLKESYTILKEFFRDFGK